MLFLVIASLFGLAVLATPSYERLMQEDAWAEWATFLAFAAAGVMGIVLALRRERQAAPEPGTKTEGPAGPSPRDGAASISLERLALLALGAFCLFVAGEEISWGQRLASYRPPDLFLEKNYQQEANLHNLLKDIFDTRWMVFTVAAAYGILLAALGRFIRPLASLAPTIQLLPWFLVVAVLEAMYPFKFTGEFAELLLGLVFIADFGERARRYAPAATARAARERSVFRGIPSGAVAGIQTGVLAVAVFMSPVAEAIIYRNAGERVPQAHGDLESLQLELAKPNVLRERLFRKSRVHKRVYTAVRSNYLRLPEEEYFLDPWNQAYWFAYQRTGQGQGQVLLYSFGPNRRRDSDISKVGDAGMTAEAILEEDDIGVFFAVIDPDREPASPGAGEPAGAAESEEEQAEEK